MTAFEWTPPAGMLPSVAKSWRTFYRHVFTTYGVTPAQYRALYLAQLGRCYGCRAKRGMHPDDPKGTGSVRLAVDHNHALGFRPEAVRGLLCCTGDMSCNRMLGAVSNQPEALERLAQLLLTAPAQSVFRALESGETDARIKGMLIPRA